MEKKLQKAIEFEKAVAGVSSEGGGLSLKQQLIAFCYNESHNEKSNWDMLDPFFSPSVVFSQLATKTFDIKFSDEIQNISESDEKYEIIKIHDLLDAIHNVVNTTEDEIVVDKAIVLLHDVSLFKIFKLLDENGRHNMFYQLNMCIVLDRMRVKPDNIDFAACLKETTNKIRSSLNVLNYETIWAVAMLNYRTHKYDSAIEFFERYQREGIEDPAYQIRNVDSIIYVGYCYEKKKKDTDNASNEDFEKAINEFKKLLARIENNEIELDPEYKSKLIDELHHGLGHFYNERAVFGNTLPNLKEDDLLWARYYMRKAISSKWDYYSCYGSMFHEYGDYERADQIFDVALQTGDFSSNKELFNEMMFYRGQTKSALGERGLAQHDYLEFENYCASTFNEDGIVHARLFKIRNELRKTKFENTKRKQTRDLIKQWQAELSEKKLSEYASEEIINEYKKTQSILDIFSALYADPQFTWHSEDLLYYLHDFIRLVDSSRLILDYNEVDYGAAPAKYLYRLKLGEIWLWCIGGEKVEFTIEKKTKDYLDTIGMPISFEKVKNPEDARKRICKNQKPDMVVVIPPDTIDPGFNEEINKIQQQIAVLGRQAEYESCFLLVERSNSEYFKDSDYFRNNLKLKVDKQDGDKKLFQFAYCMRALEILKKELLRPIPLFSLAPTHFSAAYNYQLGTEIDLLPKLLEYSYNTDERLRFFIRGVDTRYVSIWDDRKKVKKIEDYLTRICCYNNRCLVACFPSPEDNIVDNANYISFIVPSSSPIKDLPYGIRIKQKLTTKALPCYSDVYYNIQRILQGIDACERQNDTEDLDECFSCKCDDLSSEDDLSNNCRLLLQAIFGREFHPDKVPYKCNLVRFKDHNKPFIYLVVGNVDSKEGGGPNTKMEPTTKKQKKGRAANSLRILHLSDLHYKSDLDESNAENREAQLRKLIKKLRSISKKQKIDYICFTGDIAHCGKEADYEGAKPFFQEICNIFGIASDHLLLCPGNHDLDLDIFNESHPRTQKTANQKLTFKNLDSLSKCFSDFSSFCRDISSAEYTIKDRSSYILGVKFFEDLTVVCINTAWFSMDKSVKSRKPWIGDVFVNAISNQIDNNSNPVLTLMHHPFQEWEETERSYFQDSVNVWGNLTEFSDYILCGHTHERGAIGSKQGNAYVMSSGCLYENKIRTYETSFYIHTIPLKEGSAPRSKKYLFINDKWSLQEE